MGRAPCCSKVGLNRGAWTALEDNILTHYIKTHGEGKWKNVPKEAGLKRCGKSCRLRWINYLRPDIKRGNISRDEEDLIIRLHRLLGNRWSLIAGRLPGRTDNEIKNYWNSNLRKKVNGKQPNLSKDDDKPTIKPTEITTRPTSDMVIQPSVIRPRAFKCSKVDIVVTPQPPKVETIGTKVAEESSMVNINNEAILLEPKSRDKILPLTFGVSTEDINSSSNLTMEFDMGELFLSNNLSDSKFWDLCDAENVREEEGGGTNDLWPNCWNQLCNFENVVEEGNNNNPHEPFLEQHLLLLEEMLQD